MYSGYIRLCSTVSTHSNHNNPLTNNLEILRYPFYKLISTSSDKPKLHICIITEFISSKYPWEVLLYVYLNDHTTHINSSLKCLAYESWAH